MALTRQAKITNIDDEIARLLAEKKALLKAQAEADRKARTNRLCKRAGHLESLLPDTITLTDTRFNLFLSKTMVTDFAKRELRKLLDEQALEAEIIAEERAKEANAAIAAETPKPAPQAAENSATGTPNTATAQTAVVAAKAQQSAAAQPADSATASPQAAVNAAQTQRLPNNANANRQTA
jgi:hypothetical protein